MLQKEQLERAHAAAEVIAAKHEAAAWQARLQQQAADMAASAQLFPPGQVSPSTSMSITPGTQARPWSNRA